MPITSLPYQTFCSHPSLLHFSYRNCFLKELFLVFRYLWRGKHTFAIAQHKHHHSIYEEADANKRRKRYARPLIDLHMKIYRYEGLPSWSPSGKTISGKIAD